MSYELKWIAPKRILQLRFTGRVSQQDLFEADREIFEWLDQAEPWTHLLLDHSDATLPGFSALVELKALHHPKLGWTIESGVSSCGSGAVLPPTQGQRYAMVATLNDAFIFLRKVDADTARMALPF